MSNNLQVYTVPLYPYSDVLQLCSNDILALKRAITGEENIQKSEIKVNLCDSIVDEDISTIQRYFSKDAWELLKEKGRKSSIIQRNSIWIHIYS